MIKIELICEKPDKVLNIVSTQIEGLSYSFANKILRKKDIRINGEKISENISVNYGDKITVFAPEDFKTNEISTDKLFSVVFEDENIMAINKTKGIEVTSPTENITVENLLNKKIKENFQKNNEKNTNNKVYALNRLDRNTEGLVIFAKNKPIFDKLRKAMKNGEIGKYYLCEVVGSPKWNNFTAIGFLIKDDEKSEVKIFDEPRKNSTQIKTELTVHARSSGGTTTLIVKIKNGKTHQIRAHLAHIGFPIVGDGKYGKNQDNKKFKTKTQKLTAYKLDFNFTDKELKYLNEKEFEIYPTWM